MHIYLLLLHFAKWGERERERERERKRKRERKIQLSQTESEKCQNSMLYKAVPSRNGMIFSASFWIFHSHLLLKWKTNVLMSFETCRMLAGEISTFLPCLVWELHLYWNDIYPCMYAYGKNIEVFLFWNSNWKKCYFRLQNVLSNIISISTFECGNVGF